MRKRGITNKPLTSRRQEPTLKGSVQEGRLMPSHSAMGFASAGPQSRVSDRLVSRRPLRLVE